MSIVIHLAKDAMTLHINVFLALLLIIESLDQNFAVNPVAKDNMLIPQHNNVHFVLSDAIPALHTILVHAVCQ